MTPLGKPVVPDEYGNITRFSRFAFSLNFPASDKFKPNEEKKQNNGQSSVSHRVGLSVMFGRGNLNNYAINCKY